MSYYHGYITVLLMLSHNGLFETSITLFSDSVTLKPALTDSQNHSNMFVNNNNGYKHENTRDLELIRARNTQHKQITALG